MRLESNRSVLEPVRAVLERLHLFQRQHGVSDDQTLAVLAGRLGQQIALGADGAHQTHDNFFANRVNRGIRHLRKQLLEVVVDLPRMFRQDSERGIIAHTSQCFLAAHGHGQEQHVQLFTAKAKHVELAVGLGKVHGRARRTRAALGPRCQIHHTLRHPVAVGIHGRDLLLDFIVRHNALRLEIDQEHFPRFQPVLDFNVLVLDFGTDTNF